MPSQGQPAVDSTKSNDHGGVVDERADGTRSLGPPLGTPSLLDLGELPLAHIFTQLDPKSFAALSLAHGELAAVARGHPRQRRLRHFRDLLASRSRGLLVAIFRFRALSGPPSYREESVTQESPFTTPNFRRDVSDLAYMMMRSTRWNMSTVRGDNHNGNINNNHDEMLLFMALFLMLS